MFIPHSTPRPNILGYLFWRWLLKNKGAFVSDLDSYFFGPSRGMNDYDTLAGSYKKSNVKPDKLYSILPTVLSLVGDCKSKTVIDIGCGSGFFTLPLAELGAKVCGVDNSSAQIKLAKQLSPHPSVNYVVADVFIKASSIPADTICAPFVVNYARTVSILKHFFDLIYKSLKCGGKVLFVVDLPNGKSLKRFGATKTLVGAKKDESAIDIDLYRDDEKVCTLQAVYYTPETIEKLLLSAGLKNITWHKPIVSEEGISAMGNDFWNGYTSDPELGYITAES